MNFSVFFSLCLNPFFSQFFSALFALVICFVPFFYFEPPLSGGVRDDPQRVLGKNMEMAHLPLVTIE